MSHTEIPATAAGARSVSVVLDCPLQRGEQTIDRVSIRKPSSGELRGLKLTDVMQMDVGALTVLLPRITQPTLTTADVASLDPADLMQVGSEVSAFFIKRSDRSALGLSE